MGILLGAGGLLPLVASAEEPPALNERETAPVERAGATMPDTTFEGWGTFSVDGDFSNAVLVPGTHVIVALEDGNRLVRYDFDTNELTRRPDVLGESIDMAISTDGSSVWVTDAPELSMLRLRRYAIDDLTLQQTSTTVFDDFVVSLIADPNANDRVVVVGFRNLMILENGAPLPDVARHPFVFSFGSSVTTTGYLILHDERQIVVFEITATGIGERQDAERGVERFSRMPDGYALGFTAVSVPGFETRQITSFDLAAPDPDLDVRFGSVVYDEATGDVLPPGRPCVVPNPRLLMGGGWTVRPNLSFHNVLRRCGSYGEFTPVQPDRVFDSRAASGEPGAGEPLIGGEVRRVEIHGLGGVPVDGVESVALNVTAVNQRGAAGSKNYVTVWPAGFEQPTVANMNVGDGETVGNMVTVSTAAGGFVDVYSNLGEVDLTVDVLGYFSSSIAPAGSRYVPARLRRVLDTRRAEEPLGEGERITLDTLGGVVRVSGIERHDIRAAVVAVTAVRPSQRGFLRISPAGSPTPDASAMNFDTGRNTNRLVTVEVDDGMVDIVNELGTTHLTVDIIGYFAASRTERTGLVDRQEGRFVGYVPFRTVDTRSASPFGGDGRIPGDFSLIQSGWQPGSTLVTNLTAVRPTEIGYFSTTPADVPVNTSSLNFAPGDIIANQSLIEVDEDGEIRVFSSSGLAHFTLDVFGAYTAGDPAP